MPDTTSHPTGGVASSSLLAGLRVIEISSFVAAPLGGMTLAQLGAEVIRIDPLGGAADHGRWPVDGNGSSLYWAGLNKGKRSIEVDFRSRRGQELVTGLLADSGPDGGILLSNVVGRSWLEDDVLRRSRNDLIHVHVQGHQDGTPAVDYTVNAGLGFPLVTGPEGYSAPVNHVLPAWDIACGLHASIAILAAERRRRETGAGEHMTIALFDIALAMAGNLGFLAEAQLNGVDRDRIGNYLYGGFAKDFVTRDDRRVMLVALTRRHWDELLGVTSLSDTFRQLEEVLGCEFSSEGDRYKFREVIAALIAPWFRERSMSEVSTALSATSLLWSPYRSFHQLVTDGMSELQENRMMSPTLQPGIGTYMAPATPIEQRLTTARLSAAPAPMLGADTAEVLHEISGLDIATIVALRASGVIGGPAGLSGSDTSKDDARRATL